jgi:hypothetical protein
MSWGDWALWGFVATVVLTTMMSLSQGLGITRMSVPYLLGSMFSADRDRAKIIGFIIHLINGWLFALVYLFAFHSLHRATWWLGAAIGVVHGLFVLTLGMMTLPGLHPHMASERHGPSVARQLEPPGFLGLHYGRRTPVTVLIAHAAFGAILGGFYHLG